MVRVLFHCDDFGKSTEVNEAVLRAHLNGPLRSAGLMVTGEAVEDAVKIARTNPQLKVGIHLTLTDAKPASPHWPSTKSLVPNGRFHRDPTLVGLLISCNKTYQSIVSKEIDAQFERFLDLGLPLSSIDGHHHLHMHPFVFQKCIEWAKKTGSPRVRLVREFGTPLPPRRDNRGFVGKWLRHRIFLNLSKWAANELRKNNIPFLDGILGLWETGNMTANYLLKSLPKLPQGSWEVYNHLGSPGAEKELPALLNPALQTLIRGSRIELIS